MKNLLWYNWLFLSSILRVKPFDSLRLFSFVSWSSRVFSASKIGNEFRVPPKMVSIRFHPAVLKRAQYFSVSISYQPALSTLIYLISLMKMLYGLHFIGILNIEVTISYDSPWYDLKYLSNWPLSLIPPFIN